MLSCFDASFGAVGRSVGSAVGFSVGLCDGRIVGLLVSGDGICTGDEDGDASPNASGSGLGDFIVS